MNFHFHALESFHWNFHRSFHELCLLPWLPCTSTSFHSFRVFPLNSTYFHELLNCVVDYDNIYLQPNPNPNPCRRLLFGQCALGKFKVVVLRKTLDHCAWKYLRSLYTGETNLPVQLFPCALLPWKYTSISICALLWQQLASMAVVLTIASSSFQWKLPWKSEPLP